MTKLLNQYWFQFDRYINLELNKWLFEYVTQRCDNERKKKNMSKDKTRAD